MNLPSEQQRHAMRPTSWVLFWRRFVPYQLIRFFVLNLRMATMIWKSHH